MHLPELSTRVKCLESVASGRHGTVYKGRCVRTDRIVAVKKVPIHRQDMPHMFTVDMIMREALMWKRVNPHPSVLRLLDICDGGYNDNTVCFISEYCEGGDLQRLHDSSRTIPILNQVLSGMAHIHSKGIVHSDIKPANVLMLDSVDCKVADFGSAQMNTLYGGACSLQQQNYDGVYIAHATPMYAAPEMWCTKYVSYGYNADVWSLGIMAFHLFSSTDLHPYHLHDDDDYSTTMKTLTGLGQREMAVKQNAMLKMLENKDKHVKDFVFACIEPNKRFRPSASELLNHPVMRK